MKVAHHWLKNKSWTELGKVNLIAFLERFAFEHEPFLRLLCLNRVNLIEFKSTL